MAPATLKTRRFSEMTAAPLRWLVPNYLPHGKLTLLAGDGGHGKSAITLHLAACLSTGRPAFGLDYQAPPPSDVLLVFCEDDPEDTVLARLAAAGADLNRVHQLEGVYDSNRKLTSFSLAHYAALTAHVKQNKQLSMVVVDPAGAYIGDVNDHIDSELRALLSPLAKMASENNCSMQLVKHLSKGTSPKAVDRVSGSTGYVNAVRAAYLIAPNPADEQQKFFLPLKFNLGNKPPGLVYRLAPIPDQEKQRLLSLHANDWTEADQKLFMDQLCEIRWEGTTDMRADDIVQGGPTGAMSPERKETLFVLKLAKRAMTTKEIATIRGVEVNPQSIILHRMHKEGQIDSPGKGSYAAKPD